MITDPDALSGFTVGVTATRRAGEFCALLERRGARTVSAPAIRLVPLEEDGDLLEATRACLADPPDDIVVTTGVGFRGWNAAAEGWGLAGGLVEVLERGRILARGPKARGAIRAAGLAEEWSPATESCTEILNYLLARDPRGRRIAVQLHGEPLDDFVAALRTAGADVIEVPVYRWRFPRDLAPLQRLIMQITDGSVDAVAFTSAPAVQAVLRQARSDGRIEPLLQALRERVTAACVGPITAGPLEDLGVRTLRPDRYRLGNLARSIAEHLPKMSTRLNVAGQRLELRGHAVVLDGRLLAVPPAQMAVLKRLSARPGHVVSRADLLKILPGSERGSAEHAVEMAVTRLRKTLGSPKLIETVIKRGYRLAMPAVGPPSPAPSPPIRAARRAP